MSRTYGDLRATDDGWCIPRIEPQAALKLKALFPRIPKHKHAPFLLVGGPSLDADLTWFLHRYPMAMTEADRARLYERKTLFEMQQSEVLSILKTDWKPSAQIAFRHNRPPYNYQSQAAELARRLGRLLIMDDVGLGKTISALAAVALPDRLPAAIVVEAHLADQWVEDYIEAFTHMTAHIIKGTKPYPLPQADLYVFRYSNMHGWIDYFSQNPFKSVIFDEIQQLRTGTGTAKGTAAKALIAGCSLSIGLTASPIYNYAEEMWNLAEFLEPGCLGSYWEFVTEWCKGGRLVKDPSALGSHLRDLNLVIRRVESDPEVGKQMPPMNTIIHTVPYDEDVAAESEALARQLAIQVTQGTFTASGQAAREFNALMRHTTGVAKARHVAAYVNMLLAGGRKVLLAGWHRDVYDIWLRDLAAYNPVMFTGTESPKQKKNSKQAFISGESALMIMSLRSGTGLDGLQEVCHTGVVGEFDWSPQVHKQFFGRLRRPGQVHQVDGIYLPANGGCDPAMVEVLGIKSSQAAGIVDPFAPPAPQHSDTTRIKELAQALLRGDLKLGAVAALATAQPELIGGAR